MANHNKKENMLNETSSFDSLFDEFRNRLVKYDPQLLAGISLAIFLVMITTIFLLFRRKSTRRRSVLLVGLCDSGKTTLFSRLIYETAFPTQTSIKENLANYRLPADAKKQSVNLVDVPGHERLRYRFFDQFKTSAIALIFIIDSLSFMKEVKDVAEFMYNILTDRTSVQNALPILVACNKQDQPLAKGSKVIHAALEKELNSVRLTKSASLSVTDDGGKGSSAFLGKRNRDFTFADVKPLTVEFVECIVKDSNDEYDLSPVKNWIQKIA